MQFFTPTAILALSLLSQSILALPRDGAAVAKSPAGKSSAAAVKPSAANAANAAVKPSASTKPAKLADGTIASKAKIMPLQYKGPVTPGGPTVHLHGTASSIHAQIKSLNPSFHPSQFAVTKNAAAKNNKPLVNRQSIAPMSNPGKPNCDVGYPANYKAIIDGISYLNNLPGDCYVAAGPATCTRISCSLQSAIDYCNDNTAPSFQPCPLLATKAQQIIGECGPKQGNLPNAAITKRGGGWVHGQIFDTQANYNVIVSGDAGNCGAFANTTAPSSVSSIVSAASATITASYATSATSSASS